MKNPIIQQGAIKLNEEQERAVGAPFSPLLIVAGAGTGKTRTLTSRILRFLEKGVSPGEICAITFTNKGAREMEERVLAGLAKKRLQKPPANSQPFLGTFHALGARILRAEAHLLKRSAGFVIFDDQDSLSLVKKIWKGLGLTKANDGPAMFLQKISAIKNGSLVLEEPRSAKELLTLQAYELYENRLRENNAFDFDDLIQKVVSLLINSPETRAKYQKKFRHIFIDEYQDLNNAQYELIKLLGGGAESITGVGDDAQMIYGWRGSNIDLFLNFPNDWPGTTIVHLEENYRSTGTIVAAASSLIENTQYQPPGWKKKKLTTNRPAGSSLTLLEATDEASEADWIASEIHGARNRRDPRVESVAILYRTNAQSRAIEQALIGRDIPYVIYGGLKFYERREIKDVVAGLRYIANAVDEVSVERLQKALKIRGFQAFKERAAGFMTHSLSPLEAIDFFLKAADYHSYLAKNFPNAAEREENIAALIDFASEFENLPSFLERIALLQANDDVKTEMRLETPALLMTIHLAKGLEFDRVYIAGAAEGLLPHARSFSSSRALEEERRLLYVAMTRAREHLAISFFNLPSRFLADIPSETFVFKSLSSDAPLALDDEERYITLD